MDEQQDHDAPDGNSKSNGASDSSEAASNAEVIPLQPEAATPDGDDSAEAVEIVTEPTLEEQLADANKVAASSRDRMLRVAADFENYRKRTARDVEDARNRGRQQTIKEMLPVFDNLERALAHGDVTSEADAKGMVDGMRMVHRQFVSAISKLGMERVEALGETFDPALHDSIQHLHSDEYEAGQVMAMLQPGYRMGDMLVRPAMVVVSKGPAAPADATPVEATPDEAAPADATPDEDAPAEAAPKEAASDATETNAGEATASEGAPQDTEAKEDAEAKNDDGAATAPAKA